MLQKAYQELVYLLIADIQAGVVISKGSEVLPTGIEMPQRIRSFNCDGLFIDSILI